MKLKSSDRTQFDFQAQTLCTIGESALEQIGSILSFHGVSRPLWLLPSEPSQRKPLKKILETWYGTRLLDAIDVDSLETYVSTSSDQGQSHDCLVACGNAVCIDKAKMLLSQGWPSSSEGLEPSPRRENPGAGALFIVVPFGLLDGLECQGRIRSGNSDTTPTIPAHAIFDGRLCRMTSEKAIARTMCRVLQEVCTTVMASRDPMVRSVALTAFGHADQTLKLLSEGTKERNAWVACTLYAGAALHAAGVCAQNRGSSVIIEFSETLAIEGFADYHQTAAALLPALTRYLEHTDRVYYQVIESELGGKDPKDFISTWINRSEPKGTDKIINRLCSEAHVLLSDPHHAKELQPLLNLCSTQGADA